jgi:hypothetical protein
MHSSLDEYLYEINYTIQPLTPSSEPESATTFEGH